MGHNRMKYQRLLQEFGIYPVPFADVAQRKTIVQSLNASQLSSTNLFHRSFFDERSIIKEFPKRVKCLVIHQIFLIN